ncbi:unnamed protein product [Cuscuta epithymum]|uniref:2-oxoglutarate-dependent dioxygenase DAO n=1 Tax=Cuscuta epithymum TaxID=186058 RepID=A0AAV0C9D4_9ASTE|nr:unnamed protein product [Cuscuta epithymum]
MGQIGSNNNENMVPVIDLHDFPAQSKKLIEACEEWGCFRLVNHHNILPPSLMVDMKQVVKSLFDLPEEIKKRNKHVLPGSGYTAPTKRDPLYEALGLYDMASLQDVEAFCNDLDASPQQRETIVKYAKAVHELMMEIGRKLVEALGLKGELFEGWTCQFRINKYHFTNESVGSSGVLVHTDSGFLTILQDDESVGGLEVIKRSGEIVEVDPLPGSLLLNFGDMATIWSNGRFCNVRHRVMCKEPKMRLSIASFLLGPKDAAIESPPEILQSDPRRLYVPITYAELRNLRVLHKMHDGEVLELVEDCQATI